VTRISKKMSLKQFAVYVAKELKKFDIDVVLTGGAVVSIYSKNKYQSNDLDFLSEAEHRAIRKAMNEMGFKNTGKDFFHGSFGGLLSLERPSRP